MVSAATGSRLAMTRPVLRWIFDGAALNARYFSGRADGLEVGVTAHLIEARI